MVAERPFSDSICRKRNENEKDNEVGYEAVDIRYGKAVGGLIEKIDPLVATPSERKESDDAYPGHPDDPLDEVTACDFCASCQE